MRYAPLVLLFFLMSPISAFAASLYVSPASMSLAPGQSGTFTVFVESSSQAMNAVSGNISVDTAGVSLLSASKASSIIAFWATEPSVIGSNLSFEGVIMSPGYTGAAGRVLSFTVKAKTVGTYSARFVSGNVLANDGQGTDITQGLRGATITVTQSEPVEDDEPTPAPASSDVPKAPVVRSEEFPSRDAWYAKTAGTFTWTIPSDVTAVRTLLDQNRSSTPSILLDGRVASRAVSDIPEGVNYLHVQFKNAEGWGTIAHVRVNVDLTPPTIIALNEINRTDPTDPRISMHPEAKDEGSGIASFQVSVDGGEYVSMIGTSGIVSTNALSPSAKRLLIRAVDEAGNISAARELSVTIQPLASADITFITENPIEEEPIVVSGTAPVPGTKVHLLFTKDGKIRDEGSVSVQSDNTFSFLVAKGLPKGTYEVSVYVEDERGARSLSTTGDFVKVQSRGVSGVLLMVAQIVGALVALGAVIAFGFWLFFVLGKKVVKKHKEFMQELREVDTVTHRIFTLLKHDVGSYITYLKKEKDARKLSKGELSFLEGLEEDLENSESVIRKEIADVGEKVTTKRTRKKVVRQEVESE